MANLKDVIYISNEDYETLVSTGTVTIDGDTLTYDENNVYITPDKLASSTEDGLMSSSDKVKLDSLPTFGTAASKDFTTSVTSGSSDLVTSGAVYSAIDALPKPMIYKGTLGTGGTITSLPTASSSNEGFTYKVITDGTYASQSAKVGDVFISNGSAWTLIPAGDDIEDTWRQINVNGTQLLGTGISTGAVNFKNGSNISISGSGHDITISASQPTVNNGTLTIQKNGTNVATFTANQSSNVTANITVPTKVTDLSDASNYINTGDTAQAKSGSLTLKGITYIGDGTTSARAVGDAPYQTKFLDFAGRTGVLKHLNVFSGVGDYFYNADRKRTFTIKSTFKGSGADSDTYKADFYTWGTDDMGLYITYLFDWNLNIGWCVLPSKVSASTPAIIEIKNSTQMTYTDVLKLVLTGHNGYDYNNNYSGTLTDYKIEVCTNYTDDTWATVVNRSGVTDKIGLCPQYSLQTSSYTACYGIRLTITGCSVSGSGYPYIKITSMQLRNHRPGFTIPSSVGALSERGGSIYGDVIFDAKGSGQALRPSVNNTGYLGGSNYKWYTLYATNVYGDIFVENGTSLANKYQVKLPTTTTAGKVLKSTSTAGTVEWGDDNAGVTAVKIGTSSVVSSGVATIQTNSTYNASSNKIATMSDLPPTITISTGTTKSVSDGTNTLTFGNNAFNSTAIPTSYIASASKSGNTLTIIPNSGSAVTYTPTFTEQHVGDVVSVGATSGSHIAISGTTANPTVGVATDYSIPSNSQQTAWSNKYSKPSDGIPASDLKETYYLASNPNNYTSNTGTVTSVDSVSPSSGNVSLSAVRYVSQSLNDTQKSQARTNIGAGTSNFTGYTSSNKLSTDYINNVANWSSFSGYTSSNKLDGAYINNTQNWTSNTGNVTGSGLTANQIVLGSGNSAIQISSYKPSASSTTWSTTSDVYLPTMKAISSYVTGLGYTTNTGTVIGSGLTADTIVLGNGTVNVKTSTYKPAPSSVSWSSTSDVYLPTMKSIIDYIYPVGSIYISMNSTSPAGLFGGN